MIEEKPNTIFEAIHQATKAIESSWMEAYQTSKVFQNKEGSELSVRRLTSYNPDNSILNEIPETQQVVNSISNRLCQLLKSIELDPNNMQTWITIGQCYTLLNDFTNAFSAFSNVLRLSHGKFIDDFFFWYAIGCVYQHFKYYKRAKEYLDKANIIFSKMKNSHQSQLSIQHSDIQLRLALICRSLQQYDDCKTYLQKLEGIPPNLQSDDILLQKAFTHQLKGENRDAKKLYIKLYEKHKNSPDVVQQYTWYLSLQNNQDEYDEALRIINSFDPSDPTLNFASARILMKLDQLTEAYEKYCDCITYWSNSPLFWCVLGVLYFRNEQMQDAVVAFQRALYLKAELAEAWVNLAIIFERQNDMENLNRIIQSAIEKCPNSPLIREKYNEIKSGRLRDPTQQSIIEINDSRFFVQPAEKVANEYAVIPPFIPPNIIGIDMDENSFYHHLKLSYNSLFLM